MVIVLFFLGDLWLQRVFVLKIYFQNDLCALKKQERKILNYLRFVLQIHTGNVNFAFIRMQIGHISKDKKMISIFRKYTYIYIFYLNIQSLNVFVLFLLMNLSIFFTIINAQHPEPLF